MAGPDDGETRAGLGRLNSFITVPVAVISGFTAMSSVKDDTLSDARAEARVEIVGTCNHHRGGRRTTGDPMATLFGWTLPTDLPRPFRQGSFAHGARDAVLS